MPDEAGNGTGVENSFKYKYINAWWYKSVIHVNMYFKKSRYWEKLTNLIN